MIITWAFAPVVITMGSFPLLPCSTTAGITRGPNRRPCDPSPREKLHAYTVGKAKADYQHKKRQTLGTRRSSVEPPLAKTQHQKLKLGEATGCSHIAMCPLAVRFCPMVLAGLPGQ